MQIRWAPIVQRLLGRERRRCVAQRPRHGDERGKSRTAYPWFHDLIPEERAWSADRCVMIACSRIDAVSAKHPLIALIALLVAVQAAPVCAGTPPPAARAVTDDLGRMVTVPAPPLRIVCIAPGTTEMLFAAGAGS